LLSGLLSLPGPASLSSSSLLLLPLLLLLLVLPSLPLPLLLLLVSLLLFCFAGVAGLAVVRALTGDMLKLADSSAAECASGPSCLGEGTRDPVMPLVTMIASGA
jgi:hypothetical protein